METTDLAKVSIAEQYPELSKKELFTRLDTLLEDLQSIQQKWVIKVFRKKKAEDAIARHIKEALELQFQLIDLDENDLKGLLELKSKIVTLESKVAQDRSLRSFSQSISIGYAVVVCVLIFILLCDLHDDISRLLGIVSPERYIAFGFAGAILYFITNIVTGVEQGTDKHVPKVLEIFFRLILAMVVPIVLIALMYGSEVDKTGAVTKTTGKDFLSFACGYSARFVVDIFNKVVDKASKMLGTLLD